MHKHIDWDDPGADSVKAYYARAREENAAPLVGAILSARYQGVIVRIKVQAYKDETSIGDVAALVDPASGERMTSLGKLALGDTVRLPDDKRAFEPNIADKKEEED